MNEKVIGTLAAALLAAGCAAPYTEAPLATNFPTFSQPKLQAATHWALIARDAARHVAASLPPQAPVFINHAPDESAFQRAFTDQLATSLLAQGFSVRKTPDNALLVDVETQAVTFSPDRPQYRHAGAATSLGAGVWVLHDIVVKNANGAASAGLLALGAADALAWFQSVFASGATPQNEIIVSVSVADADRYLARTTNVYYVADSDHSLYTSYRTKTFQVRGIE